MGIIPFESKLMMSAKLLGNARHLLAEGLKL